MRDYFREIESIMDKIEGENEKIARAQNNLKELYFELSQLQLEAAKHYKAASVKKEDSNTRTFGI